MANIWHFNHIFLQLPSANKEQNSLNNKATRLCSSRMSVGPWIRPFVRPQGDPDCESWYKGTHRAILSRFRIWNSDTYQNSDLIPRLLKIFVIFRNFRNFQNCFESAHAKFRNFPIISEFSLSPTIGTQKTVRVVLMIVVMYQNAAMIRHSKVWIQAVNVKL